MSETGSKKEYEMAYLLAPDIPEEKLDVELAELKKIIEENGKVIESAMPKKRWLSYRIKKQNQAYFGVVYFNTNKEELGKIKKDFSLKKNLLRFLILNKPLKPKTVAAPVKLPEESAPAQSFERKLESILNG